LTYVILTDFLCCELHEALSSPTHFELALLSFRSCEVRRLWRLSRTPVIGRRSLGRSQSIDSKSVLDLVMVANKVSFFGKKACTKEGNRASQQQQRKGNEV
jgi:hypothetical protein